MVSNSPAHSQKTCVECGESYYSAFIKRKACDSCTPKIAMRIKEERQGRTEKAKQRIQEAIEARAKPKATLPPKPRRSFRVTTNDRKECEKLIQSLKIRTGCQICGYHKLAKTLAFHHTAGKDGRICFDRFLDHGDMIVRELATCCVLCHNCHTEVHANVAKCPTPIGIQAANVLAADIDAITGFTGRDCSNN